MCLLLRLFLVSASVNNLSSSLHLPSLLSSYLHFLISGNPGFLGSLKILGHVLRRFLRCYRITYLLDIVPLSFQIYPPSFSGGWP